MPARESEGPKESSFHFLLGNHHFPLPWCQPFSSPPSAQQGPGTGPRAPRTPGSRRRELTTKAKAPGCLRLNATVWRTKASHIGCRAPIWSWPLPVCLHRLPAPGSCPDQQPGSWRPTEAIQRTVGWSLCRPQEGAIFRRLRSRRGGGVARIEAYIWQGCWAWKRPRASTRSQNSANGKEAVLSLDFPVQHLSEERGPKKVAAHSWGGGGVNKGPLWALRAVGGWLPGDLLPLSFVLLLARALGCSTLLGNCRHVCRHTAQGGAHPGWTRASHAVLSGSGQGAEV